MSQKEFTIEALFKATGADQFARDFDRATGHVKGFDDSTKKSTGGLKNMMGGIGKIAAGIGVTKALSAGFNTLKNNVGAAVKRFDTLENANKVFENVGFEAENVDNMMQQLTKSLDGLPTSSSDAIDSIMKISMANDDIEGAGNLFQDLNYAILATGKGAEEVSGTTEMFSRALQRGSMNSHEWNSMMTNMGPTMKQMADVMGVSMEEMQKGLSDGSISMDTFGEVLHDVAENGNGDFADLETQARDMTSGIGTAFENFGNRVAEGIRSGLIIPLNEALEQNGMPQIADMVNMASSWIRDSLIAIGPFIGQVVEWFSEMGEVVEIMRERIGQAFEGLLPDFNIMKDAVFGLWGAIKDSFSTGNFEDVLLGFDYFIAMSLEILYEALPKMLETGMNMIGNIITGITTKVPELFATGAEFMAGMAEVLVDNLWGLVIVGTRVIISLLKGIGDKVPEWISMAVDMVVKMAQTIGDNLPTIIAKGVEMLGALARGFRDNFPAILQASVDMIARLLSSILSNLPKLIAAGIELIAKLAIGLVRAIPQVLRAMADIARGITGAVKNISLTGAGRAIIGGFVRGLKSAWESGKKFISGIGGWIKKNKGPISYDRRLLRPAGDAIIGGLNKGLQESFPDVQRTVSGMAGAIENSLTASPTMDIAGSVARSNAQVKSAVSHEISNSGNTQPAYINVNIGGQNFRGFVENISSEQGRITDLELQF